MTKPRALPWADIAPALWAYNKPAPWASTHIRPDELEPQTEHNTPNLSMTS